MLCDHVSLENDILTAGSITSMDEAQDDNSSSSNIVCQWKEHHIMSKLEQLATHIPTIRNRVENSVLLFTLEKFSAKMSVTQSLVMKSE